jgi:ankyrin repeat protein
MAAVDDEKGAQNRIFNFATQGKLVEQRALLEEHPEVNVDGYRDVGGRTALYWVCVYGYTECAQLLIDHKADVNAKDNYGTSAPHEAASEGQLGCMKLLVQNGADMNCQSGNGWTPLMISAKNGHSTVAQYLLEQKADVHYRVSKEGYNNENMDVLHCAMCKHATDRTPGIAFSFLSYNTDAKNIFFSLFLNTAMRDTHIEEYKHVQAFIDEHHRILNLVLSEHVQVDTRVGRGDYGIYQEPLERTLEYLGLSMSKDQVVNTSIDGEEAVRRALIPGHLLNANHWFDKYKSR